ncbi:glutamate-gated chloride channel-like [Ischnura elegans]|uniref:glutamate-gated chloride channel-like n=1 Tax=Ischnura elegans TaxID=197161 RepID=UPI001ED89D14|nr:glutamate-gated chloride channel-like [Ischnura elegans]
MKRLIWALAILATATWTIAARTDLRESETELLRLLLNPERYDKRVRPPVHNESGYGGDDFVMVKVNTFVRSIGPIDDQNKEFTVSLTMRQTWNDKRLNFSPQDGLKYITLTSAEDIWSPDLFFSNEIEGQINDLLKPNTLVRISHNGDVLLSSRVTMKLSCPMNLTNFPMDTQMCHIRMASYAYPTNALKLMWKEVEPVQFAKSYYTKPFELIGYKTDNCNSRTVVGEYSCIRLHFYFTRLTYSYILHLFLPLGLLVAASWAPLWLDINGEERSSVLKVVGRCVIALLCLLVTIVEAARVTASAPLCSGYSCATDIWTTCCLIFVALVFLEVVIVAVLDHRHNNSHCNSGTTKPGCFSMSHSGAETNDSKFKPNRSYIQKWLLGWPTAGQRIDAICCILFPVAFIIFNIAFWSANSYSLDADIISSMKKIAL